MFSNKKLLKAASDTHFRFIYEKTMSIIYKVAYNIVREEDAAEDICHDAFIKMAEKEMEFPSINDAKYWLIRVVKNASLNYVKRRSREKRAYERAFKEDARRMDTGEEILLKGESVNCVKAALAKLPKKLKDVLQLKEYGDLNYKEIGMALGITESNVKVRVFRAREQLSKIIGEDDVSLPE